MSIFSTPSSEKVRFIPMTPVYDLEDSLKAGFITNLHCAFDGGIQSKIWEKIRSEGKAGLFKTSSDNKTPVEVVEILHDIFEITSVIEQQMGSKPASPKNSSDVIQTIYALFALSEASRASQGRTYLTSKLIKRFIKGIIIPKGPIQTFSKIEFDEKTKKEILVLKKLSWVSQTTSPKVSFFDFRGGKMVREIFKMLEDSKGKLLPEDVREEYEKAPNLKKEKRVICDFVSGMTDAFAEQFYGRLYWKESASIFDPVG